MTSVIASEARQSIARHLPRQAIPRHLPRQAIPRLHCPPQPLVRRNRRQPIQQTARLRHSHLKDQHTIEQRVILSNLESLNAGFIRQDFSQPERLKTLNELAIGQLHSLLGHNTAEKLK
jgi:hypothetical protein